MRAPPPEEHIAAGGYTEWHRDYGASMRLPIGAPSGDYNRARPPARRRRRGTTPVRHPARGPLPRPCRGAPNDAP